MALLTEARRYALQRMNKRAFDNGLGDQLNIQTYSSSASAGGAATERLTMTGISSSDSLLGVYQKTAGGNSTAVVAVSAHGTNTIDVQWTANPGAGAVVTAVVLKAAVE